MHLRAAISYKIAQALLRQEFTVSMNKLISIQALRGIAVLGVVAYHALVIEKKYSGGDLLLPDFFISDNQVLICFS